MPPASYWMIEAKTGLVYFSPVAKLFETALDHEGRKIRIDSFG